MERPEPSTAPLSSAEPTQTPARRWVPGASRLGQRAGKGRWPVDPRHSHQGGAPGAACPLTPPWPSRAGPKWKPAEVAPGGERWREGVAGGGGRPQPEKREPGCRGGGQSPRLQVWGHAVATPTPSSFWAALPPRSRGPVPTPTLSSGSAAATGQPLRASARPSGERGAPEQRAEPPGTRDLAPGGGERAEGTGPPT